MRTMRTLSLVALLTALPLAGCSDILDVDAPGRISNEDLANESAAPGIVAGMAYDLFVATDGALQEVSMFAGELWHSGSYDFADIPRGIVIPEDWDGEWDQLQQFRWTSETGITRLEGILSADRYARSPLVAHAHLFAGIANRMLGEWQCESVVEYGGPPAPHTDHFTRGIDYASDGIPIAQAAGDTELENALYGLRAQLRAAMGDWSGAASDAAEVPDGYVYEVIYSAANDNDLQYETFTRPEYSVWNTMFEDHPDDPRAPWEIVFNADGSVATGANGADPFYRQLKYTDPGSDIPVIKGAEMLLIRAEAALRNQQIGTAYDLMNQARAVYEMDPLTPAADLEGAWDDLQYERGATLWLEGRRLWDLRRWYEETGPANNDFLEGRDKCFPISDSERQANPNVP